MTNKWVEISTVSYDREGGSASLVPMDSGVDDLCQAYDRQLGQGTQTSRVSQKINKSNVPKGDKRRKKGKNTNSKNKRKSENHKIVM